MTGILIAGTSSDAGKSLVVTGICRALARRGIKVAPFKAQNMSNNSMVCADGSEIGRAQYLQALAAGVEPSNLLNPVLLKPGTDRRSFVVLNGRPAGTLEAGQYATGRRQLAEAAYGSYRQLAESHDLIVVEGAGSPAEINLRSGDYVNMGLARQFNLPVVIVGDIDRGGVLASLYGTWGLVDDADRTLLAGYIINKFRGDQSILTPGLDEISARTGLECFGVLPWLPGVWLDGEDALQVDRWRAELPASSGPVLRVAVIRFPRISNATDVEALAHTPGVDVQVTDDPAIARAADLLVLPGSRATIDDLAWLREKGLDAVVTERHASGRPVLGICGGYQMLAQTIEDEIESSAERVQGLGVLPVEVRFSTEKTTRLATHHWRGAGVDGYEIHHGDCIPTSTIEEFLDGVRAANTFGTMLHGSLENDAFRIAFLQEVAELNDSPWRPDPDAIGYAAAREQMITTLADAVEEHLDLDRLIQLAGASAGTQRTHANSGTRPSADPNHPLSEGRGAGEPSHPTSESRAQAATEGVVVGVTLQGLASGMSEDHRGDPMIRRRSGQRYPDDQPDPQPPTTAIAAPSTPATTPRAHPLLIVHTGDGKGKSTAAFGMGLRAWSQGWSVGVFQFIKGSTWPIGERLAFQTLAGVHARTGQGGPIEWHSLGAGRTDTRAARKHDHAELAREGWELVEQRLASEAHQLVILDEFCHVLNKGWVDLDDVLTTLTDRPGHQHVVITGRGAPLELTTVADLVTDMHKLAHPFDRGIKGQPGIEW